MPSAFASAALTAAARCRAFSRSACFSSPCAPGICLPSAFCSARRRRTQPATRVGPGRPPATRRRSRAARLGRVERLAAVRGHHGSRGGRAHSQPNERTRAPDWSPAAPPGRAPGRGDAAEEAEERSPGTGATVTPLTTTQVWRAGLSRGAGMPRRRLKNERGEHATGDITSRSGSSLRRGIPAPRRAQPARPTHPRSRAPLLGIGEVAVRRPSIDGGRYAVRPGIRTEEPDIGADPPKPHQGLADPGIGHVSFAATAKQYRPMPWPVGRDSILVRFTPRVANCSRISSSAPGGRDERDQAGPVGAGRPWRQGRPGRRRNA